MKDGDIVLLVKPCRVDQYWYDPGMLRGSYDFCYLLPGLTGKVIRAKTPCVTYRKDKPIYFANVDVEYMGSTYRVRDYHDHFMVQRQRRKA
jgi:hypothetical protein